MHQWCLAGWGMPIGEMFNLERLAKYCQEKGRWTFFFSSVPLHVCSYPIVSFVSIAGLTLDCTDRSLEV